MRTTVRLYTIHSLLSRVYFFLPILVLWFQSLQFSQFEITLLISVFYLAATLSEVPTGIFSDHFGHKWAMTLSSLCQAVGAFVLAFSQTFWIAILGELLMGLGQAFYTGSKEAYLFNILEKGEAGERYQRDYAQSKLFEFVGMAIGSLIGGSIYVYSPRLPFLLSSAVFLVAAAFALILREEPVEAKRSQIGWSSLASGFQVIRNGGGTLKALVLHFCILFTLILIFTVAISQPYLKGVGIPLGAFGLLYLFFHLSAMGGSLWAKRISTTSPGLFFIMALGILLVFAGLALFHHPLSFLLAGCVYLIWGVFIPTTSDATNRLIASGERATVLSARDFLQNLFFVLLAPLVGWVTDLWGLGMSLGLLSLSAGAAVLIGLQISGRRLQEVNN